MDSLSYIKPSIKGISPCRRFWGKVSVTGGVDACWPWKSYTDKDGYGNFGWRVDGKYRQIRSNRMAWMLTKGAIPDGMHICHKCDNPRCCNPRHLFVGTPLQNRQDCVKKDRHSRGDRHPFRIDPSRAPRGDRNGSRVKPERLKRGEENSNAALSSDDVRLIRRLYKTTCPNQSELARLFNVKHACIWNIVNRRTWKHLED